MLHQRFADNKVRESLGMPKQRADRDRTDFGRRMYQARTAAKLTQEKAAFLIGVAQTTLSGWESTDKGSSHTAKAAQVYGVSATWLASGDGDRERSDPAPNPNGEEAELLAAFRKLSVGGAARIQALAYMQGLVAGESSGGEGSEEPAAAPRKKRAS